MRRLAVTLAVVLLACAALFACGGQEGPQPDTGTQAEAPDEETTSGSAPGETTVAGSRPSGEGSGSEDETTESTTGAGVEAAAEVPEAEEDGELFTAQPEMSGGEAGAAESISAVRFGVHEGYERAVIDFGAGGSAASGVPEWSLVSPTGEGYARVYLPGVVSTAVSDGGFGGGILDGFYVVRAPGGGLFVDLFATGAFQYRVLELGDPGRLAVDFRPASVDLAIPLPARGESNVVMQPRPGGAVTSPLTVSGYSRNFEASTTLRLVGPGGEVLAEQVVLANDWAETWGYFEGTLRFPAFSGGATLQVGSPSPRDGSFQGVEVPVVFGG